MEKERTAMTFSRLCLGTVQFGMNYGINNKTGKPSPGEVYRILDRCLECGITMFDTAAAYGEAEDVLGGYVKYSGRAIKVISKLRPGLLAGAGNSLNTIDIIKKEIDGSLNRLHIDSLEGYMLHDPADFYRDGAVSGLAECKKAGLIKKIGVSVYEEEHALEAVSSGLVDCVQVPYNVLDRRLDRNGFFRRAGENGVTVFARSAFLQGLLLMNPASVDKRMPKAAHYITLFETVVRKHGLTRIDAALHFVFRNSGVDYLVFGVDNLAQLEEFIKLSQKRDGMDGCLSELEGMFDDVEKEVVSPNLWGRN